MAGNGYGRVPALATVRRVQALIADGHGVSELAQLLGEPSRRVRVLTWGRINTVTDELDQAVAVLYDRLLLCPGDDTQARDAAARNGWAPPQLWTDATIGDPDAAPGVCEDVDDVLVAAVLRGRRPYAALNSPERVALWQAWEARRRAELLDGPGLKAFARAFSVGVSTAERLRHLAASQAVPA